MDSNELKVGDTVMTKYGEAIIYKNMDGVIKVFSFKEGQTKEITPDDILNNMVNIRELM